MVKWTENKIIKAIKKVRELFNEVRNNFSREEAKKIREKLHKKEVVYKILSEKDNLTKKEEKVQKNIKKYFRKFKKNLEKL